MLFKVNVINFANYCVVLRDFNACFRAFETFLTEETTF